MSELGQSRRFRTAPEESGPRPITDIRCQRLTLTGFGSCLCSACIIAICAIIGSPPCSPTSISPRVCQSLGLGRTIGNFFRASTLSIARSTSATASCLVLAWPTLIIFGSPSDNDHFQMPRLMPCIILYSMPRYSIVSRAFDFLKMVPVCVPPP